MNLNIPADRHLVSQVSLLMVKPVTFYQSTVRFLKCLITYPDNGKLKTHNLTPTQTLLPKSANCTHGKRCSHWSPQPLWSFLEDDRCWFSCCLGLLLGGGGLRERVSRKRVSHLRTISHATSYRIVAKLGLLGCLYV